MVFLGLLPLTSTIFSVVPNCPNYSTVLPLTVFFFLLLTFETVFPKQFEMTVVMFECWHVRNEDTRLILVHKFLIVL